MTTPVSVWFRDENGDVWQASTEHPFPVTGGGGSSVSSLSAEDPATYDSESGTIGVRTDEAGGVATLDGSGKLRSGQLPPLQPDVGEAADEAGMLALDVSAPAMCIRTDFDPPHVFMLSTDPATDAANWHDTGAFSNAGADPSAEVGLSSVPGTDAAYMRADAAPALDQSIEPTWTGPHTHQAPVDMASNKITSLADGSDPGDAVNLSQLQAATAGSGFAGPNAPRPAVLAYKTQDQIVQSGDLRTLVWQATVYDPHGMFQGTTDFIVPAGATHARVTVQVMYESSGSETSLRLAGAKINNTYRPGISWKVDNMGTGTIDCPFQYVSALVPVSQGDVITAHTRQYDTSQKNVRAGAAGNTFVMIELCPA